MPKFELKVDSGFKLPELPDPSAISSSKENIKKANDLPDLSNFDFPFGEDLAKEVTRNRFRKFIKDNPAVYPFITWLMERLKENNDEFSITLNRKEIETLFNPTVDDLYVLKDELKEFGYNVSIYDDVILIDF